MPAVIGGLELATVALTPEGTRRLERNSPEKRYAMSGVMNGARMSGKDAPARLAAVRQCLAAEGYRFTEWR